MAMTATYKKLKTTKEVNVSHSDMYLRLFKWLLILVCISNPALASAFQLGDLNHTNYEVYYGDVNNDGTRDYYLHAKDRMVLIHGDIVTPITFNPDESAWLGMISGTKFALEPPANGLDPCANEENPRGIQRCNEIWHETIITKYQTLQPQQPRLTDAQIAQYNFTLLTPDLDVFFADFNGDGLKDILIDRIGGGTHLIFNRADNLTMVTRPVALIGESGVVFSHGSYSVYDHDGDGRAEVVADGGEFNRDVAIQFNESGYETEYNYSQESLQVASLNGASDGSFKVDESGAATYSVPLYMPAGTAGVAPSISLAYSSGGGNSPLGKGWSINGLSSVQRCRQTKFQDGVTKPINFSSSDRFCLDGQRLVQLSQTITYREYETEIKSYSRIRAYGTNAANPDYFTVEGKDGSIQYYGATGTGGSDAQQKSGSNTLTWSLKQFEDSAGNKIVYEYTGGQENFLISSIKYAFGGAADHNAEILFNYGNREDHYGGYTAGYYFGVSKRLNSILVKNKMNSTWHNLRKYTLMYKKQRTFDSYRVSLLEKIQECAYQSNSERCLPATNFNWETTFDEFAISLVGRKDIIQNESDLGGLVPIDVNGDSYPDLAWVENDESQGTFNSLIKYAIFNPTTLTYNNATYDNGHPSVSYDDNQKKDSDKIDISVIDYNNDGRQDLAYYRRLENKWYIHLSTPVGANNWKLAKTPIVTFNYPKKGNAFADIDSDGLTDLLSDDGYQRLVPRTTDLTSSNFYHFDTNKKVFSFPPASQLVHDTSVASARVAQLVRSAIGDFNGDGSSDFVLRYFVPTSNGYSDLHYYTASLVNETQLQIDQYIGQYGTQQPIVHNTYVDENGVTVIGRALNAEVLDHVYVADVNRDGLSDLFIMDGTINEWEDSSDTSSKVYPGTFLYRMNNGNGFSAPVTIKNYEDYKDMSVQFVDLNSDGYLDLYVNNSPKDWNYNYYWNPTTRALESRKSINDGGLAIGYYGPATRFFFDATGDGNLDVLVASHLEVALYKNLATSKNGMLTSIVNGLGAETKINYEMLNKTDHYTRMASVSSQTTETRTVPVYPCAAYNNPSYCPTETYSVTVNTLNSTEFYSQINDPTHGMIVGNESFVEQFNTPVQEYYAPIYLVTSVEGSAPSYDSAQDKVEINKKAKVEYFYHGAKLQAGGKGYLGFRSLTTLDPQTGVRTETHYRQDWPFIGAPIQSAVYAPTGDLMSIEHTEWGVDGWLPSWPGAVESGSASLAPLRRVLRGSTKYTFDFVTDTTSTSTRETILAQYGGSTSDNEYCLIGDGCKTKGSTPQKVLQKTTTSQSYDSYGNVVLQTNKTEGGSLSLEKTTKTDYDGDGNHLTENTGATITFPDGRTNNYRALGRITSATVDTKRNGVALDSKTALFTYYNAKQKNQATGRYGMPGQLESEIAELSADLDKQNSTFYEYDQLGNTLQTTVNYVDVVYDSNVIDTGSRSNKSRVSRVTYDVTGRFVESNITVRADGTEVPIDSVFSRDKYGNPTEVRDGISELKNWTDYDAIGRAVRVSDSIGSWSETEYKKCSSGLNCPSGISYVVEKRAADGSLSRVYMDTVARSVRSAKKGFDGRMIYQDTEYDVLGRVYRTSEPYFENNSPTHWAKNKYDLRGRPVEIKGPDNSFSYLAYTGHSVTTTNALGFSKTQTKNGLGELVSVTDESGAEIVYDYNQKGKLTQIKVYKDSSSHVNPITTTFTYDDLGRKTSMDDPDKGLWHYRYNSLGDLVYQKDANGQVVIKEYDDLGRTLSSTDYDSSGTVVQHVSWYYDGVDDQGQAVANSNLRATAKIMSESTADTQCISASTQYCEYYTYDQYGRAKETGVVLFVTEPGQTYTTRVEYDSIGRVLENYDVLNGTVKLGTSPVLNSGTRNHYNEHGYLDYVQDMASGTRIYEILDATARGAVNRSVSGNGIVQTQIYDDATGRLTHKYAGVSELDTLSDWDNNQLFGVQKIKYQWDVLGNLTYRHNRSGLSGSSKDIQESYCYDKVNRLIKTVNGALTTGQCETLRNDVNQAGYDLKYDSLGNITYKKGVGSYTYGSTPYSLTAGAHAVTKTVLSGVTTEYRYDDNGNMVEDKVGGVVSRQLQYTTFDKPSHIKKGNHNTYFKYGPDNSRYWRKDVAADGKITETLYLGGVERVTQTDGSTTKVLWKRYLGGSAIYDVETDDNDVLVGVSLDASTTKSYLHKDHLGSIDVITNAVGTITESLSFNEWGERRNAANFNPLSGIELAGYAQAVLTGKGKTNRGYTGHEMLDEVGLIHMNGRIYDAKLARFIQADLIVEAPTHTQSYNRYSYIWNNPLNATDPSGYKIHWQNWREGHIKVSAIVSAALATYACAGITACGAGTYALIMGAIGAVTAARMGASGDQILLAAVTSAAAAYIGAGGVSWIKDGAQIFAIGLIGGISAHLSGGSFANGFITGALGAAVGGASGIVENPVMRVGVAALLGGTMSQLTGGKFANGAYSAALSAIVNLGLGKVFKPAPVPKPVMCNINTKCKVSSFVQENMDDGDWVEVSENDPVVSRPDLTTNEEKIREIEYEISTLESERDESILEVRKEHESIKKEIDKTFRESAKRLVSGRRNWGGPIPVKQGEGASFLGDISTELGETFLTVQDAHQQATDRLMKQIDLIEKSYEPRIRNLNSKIDELRKN